MYGNAGCFGLETENNFVSAEVIYIPARETRILQKQDMDFSYRSSLLKEHPGEYFLLRVTFDLSQKIEKYASDIDNIYFREHKQPKGNTCGSFFKNPSREQSAGYLIEQV
ncbi:MAG: hypothetical protein H6767_06410 [Candidatus Peribacteria bacterium]|nr:MAG: hypothetical protein H6767_06410 [Candidatus Peribacteria bacterium]